MQGSAGCISLMLGERPDKEREQEIRRVFGEMLSSCGVHVDPGKLQSRTGSFEIFLPFGPDLASSLMNLAAAMLGLCTTIAAGYQLWKSSTARRGNTANGRGAVPPKPTNQTPEHKEVDITYVQEILSQSIGKLTPIVPHNEFSILVELDDPRQQVPSLVARPNSLRSVVIVKVDKSGKRSVIYTEVESNEEMEQFVNLMRPREQLVMNVAHYRQVPGREDDDL